VFDNEMLAQVVAFDLQDRRGELPDTILRRSFEHSFPARVRYGFGVLRSAAKYRLHRWGMRRFRIFEPEAGAFDRIRVRPGSHGTLARPG